MALVLATKGGRKKAKDLRQLVKQAVRAELSGEIEQNTYQSWVAAQNVLATMSAGNNFFDLTALAASYTTASPSVPLRRGVRIRNISMSLCLTLNSNTLAVGQYVRVLVVHWRPSNGGGYVPTEGILFQVPNASAAGNNAHSFLTHAIEAEYKVLYDRKFQMLGANNTGIANHHEVEFTLKNLPHESSFDAVASDQGADHVYVVVVGDEATNRHTFTTNMKYVWTDV